MKGINKEDYLIEYEEVCKILGIIRANVKEIKSTLKLIESTFPVSIEEKESSGNKTVTLDKKSVLKLLESKFAVSRGEKESSERKTAALNKNTDFG